MYAVLETGGKQYMVNEGDFIKVDKLDVDEGKAVTFDNILMIGDSKPTKIGEPKIEGAIVKAKVVENARDAKIKVFKKLRRKGYRRTQGHRQHYTRIQITSIVAG